MYPKSLGSPGRLPAPVLTCFPSSDPAAAGVSCYGRPRTNTTQQERSSSTKSIQLLILRTVAFIIKMLVYVQLKKNGLILPTGQWYAPSAVINDAWYCMVLHGIVLYCIVLHSIA